MPISVIEVVLQKKIADGHVITAWGHAIEVPKGATHITINNDGILMAFKSLERPIPDLINGHWEIPEPDGLSCEVGLVYFSGDWIDSLSVVKYL